MLFTLPSGYDADISSADPGEFSVGPDEDIALANPGNFLSGNGIIRIFNSTTAEVVCWNDNSDFAETTINATYVSYFSLNYGIAMI